MHQRDWMVLTHHRQVKGKLRAEAAGMRKLEPSGNEYLGLDLTPHAIRGTETLKTADMIKQSGKVGRIYATSIVLEANEFAAARHFLDAYQATFKIAPAYGGQYTYDATHVLASAIRRAKSADPVKVSETLLKIDGYAPVTGSMKWTEKGEQRYGVVGVYKVNGTNWEAIMRSDSW